MRIDVIKAADARPARSRRHQASIILLAAAAAVLLAALAAILFLLRSDDRGRPAAPGGHRAGGPVDPAAITATDPEQLRPISPQAAEALNAAIPVSDEPNPAARPLTIPMKDRLSLWRGYDCLTQAIYYEAATEPVEGQRAVAQVVLNRVRNPGFPHSICGVVFQGSERATGCQFSFTCDGSLARRPVALYWGRARQVAAAAMAGSVYGPVGWATYYHADYVSPYWAPTLTKLAVVGRHIFYRFPGSGGLPGAFTARYAGHEPVIPTYAVAAVMIVDPADPAAMPSAYAPIIARPVLTPGGATIDAEALTAAADPRGADQHPGAADVPPPVAAVPASRRWVLAPGSVAVPPPPAAQAVATTH